MTITCLLVGAGIRGRQYVRHAVNQEPDFKPVAVAEPDAGRREAFANEYGIAPAMRFSSWQDAVAAGKLADCCINATLDDVHYPSSIALLNAGYDMLLEKPIARTREQTLGIARAAEDAGRRVMICHVLRYTPFYSRIKEIVESGRLGRIMHIRMAENVSWHHFTVGFVRGRFRNESVAASFILAKCCHDTDLMAWLLSGNPPVRVSSFGSLRFYTPDNAPTDAADNCYDCPHVETCIYSAEQLYVKGRIWRFRALSDFTGTDDEAREILKTSPYGRCVFKCDNDVVDHQLVDVEFADGATASLQAHGFAVRPGRDIQIFGTKGQLDGDMDDARITLRFPKGIGGEIIEETIDLNAADGHELSGHGGGDARLVADFIAMMKGDGGGRTRIEDSIYGHLIGFGAEESRERKAWVDIAYDAPIEASG